MKIFTSSPWDENIHMLNVKCEKMRIMWKTLTCLTCPLVDYWRSRGRRGDLIFNIWGGRKGGRGWCVLHIVIIIIWGSYLPCMLRDIICHDLWGRLQLLTSYQLSSAVFILVCQKGDIHNAASKHTLAQSFRIFLFPIWNTRFGWCPGPKLHWLRLPEGLHWPGGRGLQVGGHRPKDPCGSQVEKDAKV